MADEQTADVGGQTPIVERQAGGDGALSARDAANSLLDARRKDNAQQQNGEAREIATAEESPARAEDTAQETGPGETQEAGAVEETQPPIEPPRSWTKEDKELFKGLPRETQERLADRERSREGDFLRRQNEAAEKVKGLTADQQAVQQARTHYEQALPQLLQALQDQQSGEFADVKSLADVENLARTDWPRFNLWQAQQMKVAAVQKEIENANVRQAQEKQTKWSTFVADEDAKFLEKAPELANKDAMLKASSAAVEMLKDLGFSDGDLSKMWNGQQDLSLRDHRVQLLLRDGVKYREAKAKVPAAQQKPVPQVVRPGPAAPRNADADGRVKDLTERFNATGNVRDAAAALAARRAATRR